MKNWTAKRGMLVFVIMLMTAAVASGCSLQKYDRIGTSVSDGEDGEPVQISGQVSEQGQISGPVQISGLGADITLEPAPDDTAARRTEILSAMEERDETVYSVATELNVRSAPHTGAEVIGVLDKGDSLQRTGFTEDWSRVIYEGQECFVASRYLSVEEPKKQEVSRTISDSAEGSEIGLNAVWKYAGFAKITSGKAMLYRSQAADCKGRTVCINAGHGTKGGASVKTQCHPDGTPKVTGGTTSAGATTAVAVSGGMQFSDGTPEAEVTLEMAKILKEKLLARGYDVLMIRESDDVQLDNIARTVIANNAADCHIALHWDSTAKDKGAFYMSVPDVASYRNMEPVASNWQKHHALGDSLIAGLKGAGMKIFSNGTMAMDLTQTSYSTVPSVDIELGDKTSDHSQAALEKLGTGLADGVDKFFGN